MRQRPVFQASPFEWRRSDVRDKVTILEYYKGFRSVYAWLAGIGFLPPLIHQLVGNFNSVADRLYPPLGDIQSLCFTLTVGVLLLVTSVVFICCHSARRIHVSVPVLLLLAFIPLGCGLIFLYENYVREIPIATKNVTVAVSTGFERTEFAISTYGDESAAEILHDRGPWEDSIQKLWTLRSIWIVRSSLWACYTLTLGCWVAVFSLGVYQHKLEELQKQP